MRNKGMRKILDIRVAIFGALLGALFGALLISAPVGVSAQVVTPDPDSYSECVDAIEDLSSEPVVGGTTPVQTQPANPGEVFLVHDTAEPFQGGSGAEPTKHEWNCWQQLEGVEAIPDSVRCPGYTMFGAIVGDLSALPSEVQQLISSDPEADDPIDLPIPFCMPFIDRKENPNYDAGAAEDSPESERYLPCPDSRQENEAEDRPEDLSVAELFGQYNYYSYDFPHVAYFPTNDYSAVSLDVDPEAEIAPDEDSSRNPNPRDSGRDICVRLFDVFKGSPGCRSGFGLADLPLGERISAESATEKVCVSTYSTYPPPASLPIDERSCTGEDVFFVDLSDLAYCVEIIERPDYSCLDGYTAVIRTPELDTDGNEVVDADGNRVLMDTDTDIIVLNTLCKLEDDTSQGCLYRRIENVRESPIPTTSPCQLPDFFQSEEALGTDTRRQCPATHPFLFEETSVGSGEYEFFDDSTSPISNAEIRENFFGRSFVPPPATRPTDVESIPTETIRCGDLEQFVCINHEGNCVRFDEYVHTEGPICPMGEDRSGIEEEDYVYYEWIVPLPGGFLDRLQPEDSPIYKGECVYDPYQGREPTRTECGGPLSADVYYPISDGRDLGEDNLPYCILRPIGRCTSPGSKPITLEGATPDQSDDTEVCAVEVDNFLKCPTGLVKNTIDDRCVSATDKDASNSILKCADGVGYYVESAITSVVDCLTEIVVSKISTPCSTEFPVDLPNNTCGKLLDITPETADTVYECSPSHLLVFETGERPGCYTPARYTCDTGQVLYVTAITDYADNYHLPRPVCGDVMDRLTDETDPAIYLDCDTESGYSPLPGEEKTCIALQGRLAEREASFECEGNATLVDADGSAYDMANARTMDSVERGNGVVDRCFSAVPETYCPAPDPPKDLVLETRDGISFMCVFEGIAQDVAVVSCGEANTNSLGDDPEPPPSRTIKIPADFYYNEYYFGERRVPINLCVAPTDADIAPTVADGVDPTCTTENYEYLAAAHFLRETTPGELATEVSKEVFLTNVRRPVADMPDEEEDDIHYADGIKTLHEIAAQDGICGREEMSANCKSAVAGADPIRYYTVSQIVGDNPMAGCYETKSVVGCPDKLGGVPISNEDNTCLLKFDSTNVEKIAEESRLSLILRGLDPGVPDPCPCPPGIPSALPYPNIPDKHTVVDVDTTTTPPTTTTTYNVAKPADPATINCIFQSSTQFELEISAEPTGRLAALLNRYLVGGGASVTTPIAENLTCNIAGIEIGPEDSPFKCSVKRNEDWFKMSTIETNYRVCSYLERELTGFDQYVNRFGDPPASTDPGPMPNVNPTPENFQSCSDGDMDNPPETVRLAEGCSLPFIPIATSISIKEVRPLVLTDYPDEREGCFIESGAGSKDPEPIVPYRLLMRNPLIEDFTPYEARWSADNREAEAAIETLYSYLYCGDDALWKTPIDSSLSCVVTNITDITAGTTTDATWDCADSDVEDDFISIVHSLPRSTIYEISAVHIFLENITKRIIQIPVRENLVISAQEFRSRTTGTTTN